MSHIQYHIQYHIDHHEQRKRVRQPVFVQDLELTLAAKNVSSLTTAVQKGQYWSGVFVGRHHVFPFCI